MPFSFFPSDTLFNDSKKVIITEVRHNEFVSPKIIVSIHVNISTIFSVLTRCHFDIRAHYPLGAS